MKIIRLTVILFTSFLLSNCIDRYYPEGIGLNEPKLVVDGFISDNNEVQQIKLSKSVSTDSVNFVPYSGCSVDVEDKDGNIVSFSESSISPGEYHGSFSDEFLTIGQYYKLVISTPNGKNYESDYEEMFPISPFDSLNYRLESNTKPGDYLPNDGLQFYLDLDAPNNNSRYLMWEVIETYEYHSTWPIKEYLDEDGIHEVPVDYSVFTCYKTEKREEIFILSTEGFTANSYMDYKLHFVNDHTQKLMFNYSILVNQYSISNEAYIFWDNLKKNNQDDANMFNKQPVIVESNIHNIKDSEEDVLGFFGVFSSDSKRILVDSVEGLTFSQVKYCTPIKIEMVIPPEPRPLHLIRYKDEGRSALGWALPECIDCRLKGGTTVKPPYFN